MSRRRPIPAWFWWLTLCGAPASAAAEAPLEAPRLESRYTLTLWARATPEVRDGVALPRFPLAQHLGLWSRLTGVPGLDEASLVLSTWWGVDFAQTGEGRPLEADLELGYLELGLWSGMVRARVGRQLVVGGASRVTHLDGVALTVAPGAGIGLTAYGGVPVLPAFAARGGDAVGGGRLYWRPWWGSELGASFVHRQRGGREASQDVALDLRLHRAGWTFQGFGALSTLELRLAEALASVSWSPPSLDDALFLEVAYQRTAPDLFLPRSSIFSVFSEEARDEVRLGVEVEPTDGLRLRADGALLVLEGDLGWRIRAAGDGRLLGGAVRIGAELEAIGRPADDFVRPRLWGRFQIVNDVHFSVDGELLFLSQPLEGVTLGWGVGGVADLALGSHWLLALAVSGGQGPLYQARVEGMLKLQFRAGVSTPGGAP